MRLKRKQENRGSAWSHTLPHFSQICNFHDGDVLGPSVKISHHYAPQGHPFRSYPFQDSWSSMPSPVSIDMMRSTLGLPFMMLAPCIIGRKKIYATSTRLQCLEVDRMQCPLSISLIFSLFPLIQSQDNSTQNDNRA